MHFGSRSNQILISRDYLLYTLIKIFQTTEAPSSDKGAGEIDAETQKLLDELSEGQKSISVGQKCAVTCTVIGLSQNT